MTSHAISESASNTPAVPKLCTWRLQLPAPRSSTETSAAATRRFGNELFGPGAADREPALAGDHVGLVDAEVHHVGRTVENRCPRRQFERLAVALDGAAAGQRQDHHLGVAGVEFGTSALSSSSSTCSEDSVQPADSGVTSTVKAVGAAGGDVELAVHGHLTIETAVATAELTSSSAG